MPDAKIKTFDVDGHKVIIYANAAGRFYTEFDDDRLEDTTLKGLETKIRKHRRQKRVNIPITLVKTPSWRSDRQVITVTQGSITGLHARNRSLLFKGDDGESSQVDS